MTVQAFTSAGVASVFGTTDGTGLYTLPGLTPGAYYVKALAGSGYQAQVFKNVACASCTLTWGNSVIVAVSGTTSAIDFALTTSATAFSDDPLQAGITPIRLVHVLELRQRIDVLRARYSLSAYPWTDPSPVPGTTVVRAVHLTDMRTALAQAYVASSRPAPTWTPPTIVPTATAITAAQITEIRNAVNAIW
jgi:hypothetical protein